MIFSVERMLHLICYESINFLKFGIINTYKMYKTRLVMLDKYTYYSRHHGSITTISLIEV